MSKKSIGLGIIVSCVLLIGLTGCNVTTSGTTTGGREYFPNTDGYSWTYLFTTSATTETMTSRWTFSGTMSVDSMVVQKLKTESIYDTNVSTYESLMKVTDTAVLGYGDVTNPTTEASTTFSFPLEVGRKWTISGTTEAEVVARENVTVPAGTFNNCFKIRSGTATDYSDFWLAPNVGIVKGDNVSPTGASTIELTSKNF